MAAEDRSRRTGCSSSCKHREARFRQECSDWKAVCVCLLRRASYDDSKKVAAVVGEKPPLLPWHGSRLMLHFLPSWLACFTHPRSSRLPAPVREFDEKSPRQKRSLPRSFRSHALWHTAHAVMAIDITHMPRRLARCKWKVVAPHPAWLPG
jgi:hypothetical protein